MHYSFSFVDKNPVSFTCFLYYNNGIDFLYDKFQLFTLITSTNFMNIYLAKIVHKLLF